MSRLSIPHVTLTSRFETLLEALQAHLQPKPYVAAFPNALNLFANFQLLSNRLADEAARALKLYDELEDELVGQEGIVDAWEHEAMMVRISRRNKGDKLFEVSMKLRRHVRFGVDLRECTADEMYVACYHVSL